MKVRAWTSLLVVSMVVAAVLAVVSLSWKTGPTAATDGIYGIRINHRLEVQIGDFGVSAK